MSIIKLLMQRKWNQENKKNLKQQSQYFQPGNLFTFLLPALIIFLTVFYNLSNTTCIRSQAEARRLSSRHLLVTSYNVRSAQIYFRRAGLQEEETARLIQKHTQYRTTIRWCGLLELAARRRMNAWQQFPASEGALIKGTNPSRAVRARPSTWPLQVS